MIEILQDFFARNDDVAQQLARHAFISYVPALAGLLVALPVGLYIGHARRFEFAAVTLANLGRAIPSFAILSIALPISIRFGLGIEFWPVFSALFLLSIPPILVNAYVGVRSVDPDTVEAARGMGLSEREILTRIELPLAAPLIVTGLKTAAVQSVATATLASFVAGGGLGDYIRLGIRADHIEDLVGGAVLVALMALVTELGLGFVERVSRPRTRSQRKVDPWTHAAQVPRPASGSGLGV